MKPRRALSLLLILLALAVGGCKSQPPIPQEVNPDLNMTAGEAIRVVLVNDDGIPPNGHGR